MKLKSTLIVLAGFIILVLTFAYLRNKTVNVPQQDATDQITEVVNTPTSEPKNEGFISFNDTANNVSFDYPPELGTKYIRTHEWPPKITLSNDDFSCTEAGQGNNEFPGLTVKNEIGDMEYCIKSVSEGAAGTTYINYTYTFTKEDSLVDLSFVLAYPQCGNYDDPKKTECETERQTFDLDSLVGKIARSIKM